LSDIFNDAVWTVAFRSDSDDLYHKVFNIGYGLDSRLFIAQLTN
jgi:hypothetical protein